MPDLTQTCRLTGKPFVVSEWEQDFLRRMQMPVPTLCPEERQRKRLANRNERSLYQRTCDHCKKNIVALYPAGTAFPVYCGDCFWGDSWDGRDHGQTYDLNRPFFEQFKELFTKVPRVGVLSRNSQNSDYTNCEEQNKNCYLTFGGAYSEDCMYSNFELYCKNCVDCSYVHGCELCYECVELENCYHCFYLSDSQNCSDCFFGNDLIGCHDCFGCKGLRNKKYYIFNEPYSEEDYKKKVAELLPKIRAAEVQARFQELVQSVPTKFAHITNCENSTGGYLSNSQNCHWCFDAKNGKDSMYVTFGESFKDVLDCNVSYVGTELVYNSQSVCLSASFVRCSNFSWNISFSDYCDSCHYSKNLFGCVGLKHKEYCILNKQYTKEEYEALISQIIEKMKASGEWGEFFPYSPFAYNETIAQEYSPLTREEAERRGYTWKEENSINNASGEASSCQQCGKVYRIIPQEKSFYEQMGLASPVFCYNCRHKNRIKQRNLPFLWKRACTQCQVTVDSTYSLDRPEQVYCEKCYLETVY